MPFGPIIRLLILTGQCRGEVAGMDWSELSDDLTIWSLPPERTKNRTAHNVPLSTPVRGLLKPFMQEDSKSVTQAANSYFRASQAPPLRGGRKPK